MELKAVDDVAVVVREWDREASVNGAGTSEAVE